MKAAFVTCVQLGLSCIERIYEIGGKLDLLITLKDDKSVKKSGRIYLDEFSKKNKVPLYKINHINDADVIQKIKDENIEWLFIIGWSQIASSELINAPVYGAVGMHPTLLPVGRGRASIPWAILKGLDKTGVTMFKLDNGVDTGPILAQYEIALTASTTATELYQKVNDAHKHLIEQIWPAMMNGSVVTTEQDEREATYWEGRTPDDGRIISEMTTDEASRLIRATNRPYPGAFFVKDKVKYIVWSADFTNDTEQSHEVCLRLKDGILVPKEFDVVRSI